MKLQIYYSDLPDGLHALNDNEALLRIMARGRVQWMDEGWEENLCQLFGIARQQDLPLAALARIGLGAAVDSGYWLLASPVNLALQRDTFSLGQPAPLWLTPTEDESLRASLNQHFAEDGLVFLSGAQGHWHVCLKTVPDLVTTSLARAAGRDITHYLPQGADAQRWRQLLNEIQMLLFHHPVNQVREAQNKLPVNSIWLHGGGEVPTAGRISVDSVYSGDVCVQGAATLSGMAAMPVQPLQHILGNKHETCLVQAAYGELGCEWAAELWQALKLRQVSEVIIYFAWEGRMLTVSMTTNDTWKFWRRPKTIEAYI
ncbi:hypothetical protein SAMN05192560_1963 [Methylobacillus rhizosphaerae]|uniref:Phosphoglycerate mutase n=1 Tax=Methylobacillus rhizosphaerae TaxID=551994 RepID=A0A239AK21_9PROT|nr:hypothetical protein [Methylobacillus rhizosphaerae]SNR96017.1 hypothetical protein SAMN05192560_1963 [Methylobacillus rhizosphaerae]